MIRAHYYRLMNVTWHRLRTRYEIGSAGVAISQWRSDGRSLWQNGLYGHHAWSASPFSAASKWSQSG